MKKQCQMCDMDGKPCNKTKGTSKYFFHGDPYTRTRWVWVYLCPLHHEYCTPVHPKSKKRV